MVDRLGAVQPGRLADPLERGALPEQAPQRIDCSDLGLLDGQAQGPGRRRATVAARVEGKARDQRVGLDQDHAGALADRAVDQIEQLALGRQGDPDPPVAQCPRAVFGQGMGR